MSGGPQRDVALPPGNTKHYSAAPGSSLAQDPSIINQARINAGASVLTENSRYESLDRAEIETAHMRHATIRQTSLRLHAEKCLKLYALRLSKQKTYGKTNTSSEATTIIEPINGSH